jgi:hypothetical protein
VLRGYLTAMVVAWTLDDSGQPLGLLPRIGGSEAVALLLLAAGVLGSIWLGRRSLRLARGPRLALYAGSVVLVLVALGGFLEADSSTRGAHYTDVGNAYSDNPYSPYHHVEDLFIYDQHGKLITNARVFDEDGEPLRIGNPTCYDEEGSYQEEVTRLTYPYCPERDPFRVPEASAEADPTPTGTTGGPGVMPGSSAGVGPSASPPVSPSASSGSASPAAR